MLAPVAYENSTPGLVPDKASFETVRADWWSAGKRRGGERYSANPITRKSQELKMSMKKETPGQPQQEKTTPFTFENARGMRYCEIFLAIPKAF